MDKKQKSQFVKFFLVSLVLLAASFCWHEIANPTFFSVYQMFQLQKLFILQNVFSFRLCFGLLLGPILWAMPY